MSVGYVGETVRGNSAAAGQFSAEKTEMAIPRQVLQRYLQTPSAVRGPILGFWFHSRSAC